MADIRDDRFIPIVKADGAHALETFLAREPVGPAEPMERGAHRGRPVSRFSALAAALVVAAALAPALASAPASAPTIPAYGSGIVSVSGSTDANFSLADGGTYYLGLATDDASSFVDAQVLYNGTLAAALNESGSGATLVSLAAGNYTLALRGHGRAAVAWDFTDGSVQNFPDNRSVLAFLRPASPRLDIVVSMGNAQEIHLRVFDDRLLPVADTNVTASGSVAVDLPSGRSSAAYIEASVVTGAPVGVFGLAWSSPVPATPGPDLASQILAAVLWIAVPVAIVFLVFLALQRRRARGL